MGEIEKNLILCQNVKLELRTKAYNKLTMIFASDKSIWGDHLTKDDLKKILKNILQDLYDSDLEVSYGAIGFLGCVIENSILIKLLSVKEEFEIFETLTKLLEISKEKKILTRVVFALAKSKLSYNIYSENVNRLINLMKKVLETDGNNVSAYEAIHTIIMLIKKIPSEMKSVVSDWLPTVFPKQFYDHFNIRSASYMCVLETQLLFKNEPDFLKNKISPFVPALKSEYCKKMTKYLEEDCQLTLRIWCLIVTMLRETLHAGTSLVNSLLVVVEKAFKCANSEMRCKAFEAWAVLIDNFALEPKILNHPKRLKLLVAPFRSNNAKCDEVAVSKLLCWWHLVCRFDKTSEHFDIVVAPLLNYAFHQTNQTSLDRSLSLTSSSYNPKYPSLAIKSVEVLVSLLTQKSTRSLDLSIPKLDEPLINAPLFLRHHQLFFKCSGLAFGILDAQKKEHLALGTLLLNKLFGHVNNQLSEELNKKETADLVKEFLSIYGILETLPHGSEASGPFLFEFMKMVTSGDTAFSSTVMNSRNFNVPTGATVQNLMNGTLSNYVIHKSLKPVFLQFCDPNIYLKLWNDIIHKSNPVCGKLDFFNFVVRELLCALNVLDDEKKVFAMELWIQTGRQLLSYIELENDVNQGDSSEHDWSCMYSFFLFPIQTFEDCKVELESTTQKIHIVGMWEKLWKLFSSLCSLTPTAEPNSECEYIARKVLCMAKEGQISLEKRNSSLIIFVADLLHIMLKYMKFSELGKKSSKTIQSPAKVRTKPHPLHNLGGCVELFTLLLKTSLEIVGSQCGEVVQALLKSSNIITKSTPSKLAWALITSLIDTLVQLLEVNPSTKFASEVEYVILELWVEFANLCENFLNHGMESEHLTKLTPLFITTLCNSHAGISHRAKLFWENTFQHSNLSIPKHLSKVLDESSFREKENTHLESTSPEKILSEVCGLPTPVIKTPNVSKLAVSSENVPAQHPKTPQNNKIRNGVQDMKDEDFVKVSTPKTKKRLLTPHQAEKMKERASDIPALYNDLSQSASQLPPGFATQDSIDNSMDPVTESKSSKELKKEPSTPLNFEGCFATENMKTNNSSNIRKSARKSLSKPKHVAEEIVDDVQFVHPSVMSSGKENRHYRKRKCMTPNKKSLEEVRDTLKGRKFSEDLTSETGKSSTNKPVSPSVEKQHSIPEIDVNPSDDPKDSDSESEIPDSQNHLVPDVKSISGSAKKKSVKRKSSFNEKQLNKKIKCASESKIAEGSSNISYTNNVSDISEENKMNSNLKESTPIKLFGQPVSPQKSSKNDVSPLASPLHSPVKMQLDISENSATTKKEAAIENSEESVWVNDVVSGGKNGQAKTKNSKKRPSPNLPMKKVTRQKKEPKKNLNESTVPVPHKMSVVLEKISVAEQPTGTKSSKGSLTRNSKIEKATRSKRVPTTKKHLRRGRSREKPDVANNLEENETEQMETDCTKEVISPDYESVTKESPKEGSEADVEQTENSELPKKVLTEDVVQDGVPVSDIQPVTDEDNKNDKEMSPEKTASISKLVNSVGTPERKHLMKKSFGSRGAIMLACAQRTMQKRNVEDSPVANQSKVPAGQSPLSSRKRLSDLYDEAKPWAKHNPSPCGSPSSSILKKKLGKEDAQSGLNDSFTSDNGSIKLRRVSFADPPVSESVEIPPSPQVSRFFKRVPKRLNLSDADTDCLETNGDGNDKTELKNKPIYSSLKHCEENVEILVPQLTDSTDSLLAKLQDLCMQTVGDLCMITADTLDQLPIKEPKNATIHKVLKDFESQFTQTGKDVPNENKSEESKDSNEACGENELQVSVNDVNQLDHDIVKSEKCVCGQQNDAEVLSQAIGKLKKTTQIELLKKLISFVPYNDVIDAYCDFLRKPNE